jgi:hypothetical protein
MPKMPSAITRAILVEIVNLMRQSFNTGKYKWTTKELSNEIRKILGPNITNDKVRYILEEYQGGILTPWWKSTYGDKVTWELYE